MNAKKLIKWPGNDKEVPIAFPIMGIKVTYWSE